MDRPNSKIYISESRNLGRNTRKPKCENRDGWRYLCNFVNTSLESLPHGLDIVVYVASVKLWKTHF